MKKSTRILMLMLIILATLAISSGMAFASEYDHCADALKALGLFQGSANGYELDRPATRAEAAVMLVRLLGAEETALGGNLSHPFTDVPEWADPYIAYMYETGLTKGASATTFNPQGLCDLPMFCSFVLRALSYDDAAGDFTYATAGEVAMQLGVVDIMSASGDFTRDNMVAIAYTALFTKEKGGETTLLDYLLAESAVDAEAAQPYQKLFANYQQIQAANAQLAELGKTPMEMKLGMAMTMDMGEESSMKMGLDSLLQMDVAALKNADDLEKVVAALDKVKLAMTSKITIGGEMADLPEMEIVLDLYLLDGVLYLNHNLGELLADETIPAQLSLNINSLLGTVNLDDLAGMGLEQMMDMSALKALMPADPYAPHYGIAMVKSIKREELTGGGYNYDVTYINISNELIQSLMNLIYGDILNMPELTEIMAQTNISTSFDSYRYTLDKDGNLKAQEMALSMRQTMFPGTEEEVSVNSTARLVFEISKTGSQVQITLPGKADDYVDIMEYLTPTPEPVIR